MARYYPNGNNHTNRDDDPISPGYHSEDKIDVVDLYENVVDDYNNYIRMTQKYFRGEPMSSEEEYNWYSFLYDLHIPAKGDNSDLLAYMKRYGLTWEDLNFRKTHGYFGNSSVSGLFGAVNFVSHNIHRLYR